MGAGTGGSDNDALRALGKEGHVEVDQHAEVERPSEW